MLSNIIHTYKSYFPKNNSFTFLNLGKTFKGKINWNFKDYGKLWTYNLNYFDFLNQSKISKKQGISLIDNYIENIQLINDGLEPYPVSLRLINWIKFISKHKIKNPLYEDLIFSQAKFLSKNLEYHLLGNHLLENAFSLLFASIYLNDNGLYKKAERILLLELKEQILTDGAHFELTPMYHCIIFYRLLDSINLLTNNKSYKKKLTPFLRSKASLMLSWLINIKFKNGALPLFNDSVVGVAPKLEDLLIYAQKLNILNKKVLLGSSGYYKLISEKIELISKVGEIGPDYIPGHAHADSFSFVLHIDSLPFIIDTGISTYDTGELRLYQRSTFAHNTVVINDKNSSDVWSSFRVGKRAKTKIHKKEQNRIICSHNGYDYIHQREFNLKTGNISIIDMVETSFAYKSKAILHFDPTIVLTKETNMLKTNLANILFVNASSIEILDCDIAKEFNILASSKKVIIHFQNRLETKIIANVKNN